MKNVLAMVSLCLVFLPLLVEYIYKLTDEYFSDRIGTKPGKHKKMMYVICKSILVLGVIGILVTCI